MSGPADPNIVQFSSELPSAAVCTQSTTHLSGKASSVSDETETFALAASFHPQASPIERASLLSNSVPSGCARWYREIDRCTTPLEHVEALGTTFTAHFGENSPSQVSGLRGIGQQSCGRSSAPNAWELESKLPRPSRFAISTSGCPTLTPTSSNLYTMTAASTRFMRSNNHIAFCSIDIFEVCCVQHELQASNARSWARRSTATAPPDASGRY